MQIYNYSASIAGFWGDLLTLVIVYLRWTGQSCGCSEVLETCNLAIALAVLVRGARLTLARVYVLLVENTPVADFQVPPILEHN